VSNLLVEIQTRVPSVVMAPSTEDISCAQKQKPGSKVGGRWLPHEESSGVISAHDGKGMTRKQQGKPAILKNDASKAGSQRLGYPLEGVRLAGVEFLLEQEWIDLPDRFFGRVVKELKPIMSRIEASVSRSTSAGRSCIPDMLLVAVASGWSMIKAERLKRWRDGEGCNVFQMTVCRSYFSEAMTLTSSQPLESSLSSHVNAID
jgi:hypothetical protein